MATYDGKKALIVDDFPTARRLIKETLQEIGFECVEAADVDQALKLFDEEKLQVTKWGTLKTDFDTMETNLQGVFAAGDIIRGASLVVWAIKDGRDAALSIEKYLKTKSLQKTEAA